MELAADLGDRPAMLYMAKAFETVNELIGEYQNIGGVLGGIDDSQRIEKVSTAILEGNQGVIDAAVHDSPEIVVRLMTEKSAPFVHQAAQANNLELLAVLHDLLPDQLLKDGLGRTPLHFAPSLEIVLVLTEKGYSLRDRDSLDRTPVWYMARRALPVETYKRLVEMQADFLAADRDGITPVSMLQSETQTELSPLLKTQAKLGLLFAHKFAESQLLSRLPRQFLQEVALYLA